MRHVKQIREVIDLGQFEEALSALDDLLSLGPNNMEALKLKAWLYEREGRFAEANATWDKILLVDRTDQDAISYLYKRQLEDREHFYFTDDLPGGGRRFLAYPKALVNSAGIGLVGCLVFLMISKLSTTYVELQTPTVLLGSFFFFVILPWLNIVRHYIMGLRSISVAPAGVEISTRFRTFTIPWKSIEKVYLSHSQVRGRDTLSLIFMPKSPEQRFFEVDLEESSSSIRARTHLIREITRIFEAPLSINRQKVPLEGLIPHKF